MTLLIYVNIISFRSLINVCFILQALFAPVLKEKTNYDMLHSLLVCSLMDFMEGLI